MKLIRYTGTFIANNGHKYELQVSTNGFICAFFLLTADAIRSGRHYQLNKITDEEGNCKMIDDILKVSSLIK